MSLSNICLECLDGNEYLKTFKKEIKLFENCKIKVYKKNYLLLRK